MPQRTAVINVVGLSTSLLGSHAPNLERFISAGSLRRLQPVLPAVTTTVQSSMLTGLPPGEHGIVGNGWFDRDLAEIHFWKQSNRLVQGEKVWETARKRDPSVTTLNMFWWFNMATSADFSVTPRPIYKADGRKIPDCYSHPPELRDELQSKLGPFPLFRFWGPAASIISTQWIADATILAFEKHQPTLTLIYLPHLDYALQKFGPNHAESIKAVSEIDAVIGDLLAFFDKHNVQPIILSEYGIEAVDDSIHINRVLREAGLLRVRTEQGLELLDPIESAAFAVVDHQLAHVYCNGGAEILQRVADVCRRAPGVEQCLDRTQQHERGIAHARTGDFVLIAQRGKWFSYDYWLDDANAPDFARTVDIHRKPGYDPLELFIDPTIRFPKLRFARKLMQKKLGFRTLMDVIPLDMRLVRGSHGRIDNPAELQPVLITRKVLPHAIDPLPCAAVRDVILEHLFDA